MGIRRSLTVSCSLLAVFDGSIRSSRLDGLNRCELLASATACLRCDTLSRSSKLFGWSRSVSRTVHPRLLRGQWCGAAPCGVCSIRPYFLFTPRCRVRRNTLLSDVGHSDLQSDLSMMSTTASPPHTVPVGEKRLNSAASPSRPSLPSDTRTAEMAPRLCRHHENQGDPPLVVPFYHFNHFRSPRRSATPPPSP